MLRYAEIMQMFPPDQVMAKIKVEEFPQEIADIMGLPASLKRSEFEQKEMETQQQEQMMAMQQAELAKGGQGA